MKHPLERRTFLKATALLSIVPSVLFRQEYRRMNYASAKILPFADSLLKQWCQALLQHQIHKPNDLSQHGGIYSPGDKTIPGRCADAIYPFLWMAKHTGDAKYVEAAKNVYNWEQHNCSHKSGAWLNDPGEPKSWTGITVFGVIAKMEAINHYPDLLGKQTVDEWKSRTQKAAEWVYQNINIGFGNINYPATTPYAMHLSAKMFGEEKYAEKAHKMATEMMSFFTPENLLWGEGGREKNEHGLFAVDLGYNIEESLPFLALYANAVGNKEMLDKVYESLKVHLEFMLPNGMWDNSWGTRNFKWTVWGSRTSNGCHPAYYLFANKEPVFAKAVYQNLKCLQQSTHNNVLTGGFHESLAGVKPSIHHTFEHAIALATLLNMPQPEVDELYRSLPREKEYGIKPFQDIKTTLFSKGNWRGTVTAYNYNYNFKIQNSHCSGGALSCLYHTKLGLLCAASMTEYQRIEKHNMLDSSDVQHFMSLTPRLEWTVNDEIFRNISYHNATIETLESGNSLIIKAESKLVNGKQDSPASGSPTVFCEYKMQGNSFSISIKTDKKIKEGVCSFFLPVISSSEETIETQKQKITIIKEHERLNLSFSQAAEYVLPASKRIYNFVPGLQAFPLKFHCENLDSNPLIIQFKA